VGLRLGDGRDRDGVLGELVVEDLLEALGQVLFARLADVAGVCFGEELAVVDDDRRRWVVDVL